MKVRSVVNRAIAKYFIIEKSYKAMFAQGENYHMVKNQYLLGKVSINQVIDAQDKYFNEKLEDMGSKRIVSC